MGVGEIEPPPPGKQGTPMANTRQKSWGVGFRPPWAMRLSMLLKISTTTLSRCSVSAIMSHNKSTTSSTRGLLAYVYGGSASAGGADALVFEFSSGNRRV